MTKLVRSWYVFASLTLVLAALFGVEAQNYRVRYSLPLSSACGIYASFVAQLVLAIAPGFAAVRTAAARVLTTTYRQWSLLALWCLPYFLYAAGTGDWRWAALARLLAVAVLLLAIYTLIPGCDRVFEHPPKALPDGRASVGDARFTWQDAAVGILLVAAVLSRFLHGIWNVPVNLDFLVRLYLLALAAWTWTFVRRVPQLGYHFGFSGQTLRAAGVNFVCFAAVAIPLGLWLKFTAWNPRWHGAGAFVIDFIEIFLFIALLEEMFFRGFLQSLLSRSFESWWKAQAVVALLFGFFHILHAPFPNWKYVLLASIAGWFYGSAFRNGGGLMASALVHAMVDTVWRTLFTR